MPEPRSPSVLVASSERQMYGGERQAALLARGLARRGHAAALLAREDGGLARHAVEAGIEVFAWDPGHTPSRLLRTRRMLRTLSPDVLHCNDPRAMTAASGVAVGLGIPVRVASRRVAFPIRSPLAYRALADGVICVSAQVRDICLRAGIPAQRLHVVPDGVEESVIEAGDRTRGRSSLGIPDDARVALTVASLNPAKGHTVLLEAMEPLLRAQRGLHLVLAGDGPLRDELVRRASAIEPERVHLAGYRDDVPDLLAAADLFVFPSLREGLGSALLEAMLAGLPCVASDLGGTREALSAGEDGGPCGWLVPPEDPEELRATIERVLGGPTAASERALRARRRARATFTAERMVEGTLGVYRELLERES